MRARTRTRRLGGTAQRMQMRALLPSSLSGEGGLGEGDPLALSRDWPRVRLGARTAALFLVIVRVTPFVVG